MTDRPSCSVTGMANSRLMNHRRHAGKGVKDIKLSPYRPAIPARRRQTDRGSSRVVHRYDAYRLNPEALKQMLAGELAVEFVPQGTWAERVRCGGAGLGGVLTPTGVGTSVEEGKQKLVIDGKEYLLELPLHADVALVKATKADTAGNLYFRMNSRATNSTMLMRLISSPPKSKKSSPSASSCRKKSPSRLLSSTWSMNGRVKNGLSARCGKRPGPCRSQGAGTAGKGMKSWLNGKEEL